ncbi:MAG: LysE family translocator [Gammaproteobacteria bacterium]|nr:LysE family translocator [Gammaproteobacteria bacterium]
MITIETLTIFLLASVALAIAPGPDNIFVLTQSAVHGRAAGLLVTLGLCTGLLVHTAAVILGVAAIFKTSVFAFNVLKILGASYLLYLAWQAFRAGLSNVSLHDGPRAGARVLYMRGIVMNVTNPKVAIFFMAFLPQFANPETGSLTLQLILFGVIFILVTLLVFGTIAWTAGMLGEWLKGSKQAQIVLHRVAGAVFAALAIRLIFVEQ